MAETTDYVDLTITINDTALSEPNFGSLLVAGNSPNGDPGLHTLAATPSGASAYVSELGGDPTDRPYAMIQTIVSQTPHVNEVLWFNTKSDSATVLTVEPLGPVTPGKKWTINVNGVVCEHVAQAGDDLDDVSLSLSGQVDAVTGASSTNTPSNGPDAATFTIEEDGAPVYLEPVKTANLRITVAQTTDTAANLLLAQAAELGDFYGVVIDVENATDIAAAAAWVEANRKLAVFRVKDASVLAGGGVLETLEAANYHRSALLFSGDDNTRADAALMGRQLAFDPGQSGFGFRQLAGVTFDELTPGQISAIKAKNGITYTRTRGVSFTDNDCAVSGRPLALTRNIDWLEARIVTNVLSAFINNEIVIIDLDGIATFEAALRSALDEAERARVILPGWTVRSPKLEEMNSNDINAGIISAYQFEAVAARGAKKIVIRGSFT